MTALVFDPDPARKVAQMLCRWGDQLNHVRIDCERALDAVGLDGTHAWRLLDGVAQSAWSAALFVQHVAEQVVAADDISLLYDPRAVAASKLALAAGEVGLTPAGGDPGGTFDVQQRAPRTFGGEPASLGLSVVSQALADTVDSAQIRADEFELVQLGPASYLVVLPGVTDLSHPDLGLAENRTVRDLDQAALGSFGNTGVEHNAYARMVWDGLLARGVKPGADLMIVGHSFGADTALDLASDPGFNGEHGFHVSHVVAAGYASSSQFPAVPKATKVLVMQNNRDVPAGVEELLLRPLTLLTGFRSALDAPVTSSSGDHLVYRFDGGGAGFGHHPSNYADALASASDPAVVGFLASLGAATGLPSPPRLLPAGAIDVSVP